MRNWKSWVIISFLAFIDIGVFYGIFYLAFLARNLLTPLIGYGTPWQVVIPIAQLGTLLGVGFFTVQGVYPGYGLTAVKELESLSKNITIIFFLLASVFFLIKPFQEFSRFVLFISWVFSLIIIPISHFIFRNILSRSSWYGIPVLVYGNGPWAKEVASSLKSVRRLGWNIQDLHPTSDLNKITSNNKKVQTAVLALESGEPVGELFRRLNQHFRKVVLVRQTDIFSSLWVTPRDLDGKLGLEFHYHLLERRATIAKRIIDIVGSLLLIFLLCPLFGIIILLIMLDSPGKIFFKQERIGQNFNKFNVLKFRTMEVGAEENLQQLFEESNGAHVEFRKFHKIENDPRITRMGKWLRRVYLDEIPQLWNVLRGEMSLVGPRPMVSNEIDKMGTYAPVVLRVKPGMTGWWQVRGMHQIDFDQRVQMEEYYISNWSLWMDIYIILKTVGVVLSGKGI